MNEPNGGVLSLRELLWRCTVRVRTRDLGHNGSGFFVTRQHVITCAHVVGAVGETVTLEICGGTSFSALVRARLLDIVNEDFPDLALLEVTDSRLINDDYVVLDPDIREGDELISDGFTAKYPRGDSLTTWYEGSFPVNGYSYGSFLKLKEGQVEWGFSGSPLLNRRTGAVCGLIKSTRNFQQSLGGRAISASLILEVFKDQLAHGQSSIVATQTKWGKLRLLSCAADGGAGNVHANFSAFFNNWIEWGSIRLQQLGAGDFLRGDFVPSPIESHWQDFLRSSWRAKLSNDLEAYTELICEPGFEKLPRAVPNINGSYERVRSTLAIWLKTVINKWHELERSTKKDDWATKDKRKDIHRLHSILNRIEQFSIPDKMRLSVAFLIFGPIGCGKSQFLCSRKAEAGVVYERLRSDSPIPLFLPLDHRSMAGGVETVILDKVREASGNYAWKSLDDFDAVLSLTNGKLVIIIDDLDQVIRLRGEANSICDVISEYTKYDSFAYLFAIQDTQLDLISRNSDSWVLFSYENPEKEESYPGDYYHIGRMAGWMNLAEMNQKGKIGYKILEQAGEHKVVELLVESGNVLSPLEAKILLDLIRRGSDIHTVVSLNFFGFLEEFWKKLSKKWELSIPIVRIKSAISCVTKAVVSSSSLTPPLEAVKTELSAANVGSEDALSLLKQASLLTVDVPNVCFRMAQDSGQLVHLNYPFLWNEKIAEQIWDQFGLISAEHEAEAISLLRSIEEQNVREGVWEFLLLLADDAMASKRKKYVTRDRAHHIWELAIEVSELPARAPCFAARWASERTQIKLASVIRKKSSVIVERAGLFALAFFAMETPTISPFDRFALLRPYYRDIHENGLTRYFLYGAERTLCGLEEPAHLENCLSTLATSHLTGCEKDLAYLAWEAFVDIHGRVVQQNLEILMSGYLRYDSDNAAEEYQYCNANQARRPRYFRQEFLQNALQWSWRNEEVDSVRAFFELLLRIGWYEGAHRGIHRRIANEMRSEANLSFGRHFRWLERQGNWANEEIDNYKVLVANLLKGHIQNVSRPQELGYFMLRHTDFTAGHTAHIPPALWDEVDLAYRIEGLNQFLSRYPITKQAREN